MSNLNKKLAEWTPLLKYGELPQLKGWCWYGEGYASSKPPDFEHDPTACFKWLIPDTQTDFNILFREIHWTDGTIFTQCELTLDFTRKITGEPVEGRIKDKAALAFCKAIEKLIDTEEK